ncbi:hypothetical protein SEA_PHONEGINGI_35 [Microbacterium phage Phonegingi]|nr:hypothetical protein SEA_PHONEGINGI_35 [Microbacterium phage Phonegingi]
MTDQQQQQEFDAWMIYAGRRMFGTKCVYVYVVQSDSLRAERAFAKPLKRGVPIGGTFEVHLGAYSDDSLSVGRVGASGEQIVNTQMIAEWSATDKATAVMLARLTHDRKLAREADDPIERALMILRDAMKAQRTIAARAAFSEYVNASIHGAR